MVQPQMSMMQQPVTMQVIPTTGKDRQQVITNYDKIFCSEINFTQLTTTQSMYISNYFYTFFLLLSYSFWMIS